MDALTEHTRDLASEYINPAVEQMRQLVEDAKDLKQLVQQLHDFVAATPPEELQAMIEKATIMAELAGRHAVLEDL